MELLHHTRYTAARLCQSRLGKLKVARDTVAVTAAASDRGGKLVAVG
jgi:hypothetical protein